MIDEIKDRIRKIIDKQIPTGYVKTEEGAIIPLEFNKKSFGELFEFYGGIGVARDELSDEGNPYLHYGDMHKTDINRINYEDYLRLPKCNKKVKESNYMKDGDIAFLDASEDLRGTSKIVLIENKHNKEFVAGLHTFIGRNIGNELQYDYRQFITSAQYIKKQFAKYSQGFKVYGVTRDTIKNIVLYFPKDKEEQRKISEILLKFEKVIKNRERLIGLLKEKRRILMSHLLKHKNEWDKKSLKDVVEILSGFPFKSEEYTEKGNYKIITIANVKENEFDLDENTKQIKNLPENIQNYQILKNGDILMSLTGNVGRTCIVNQENCLLNQRVAKIKIKEEYSTRYVYYCMQTHKFVSYMQFYAQGAAQDNLSVKDIYNYQIYIPKTKAEQEKIGEQLYKFDYYINLQIEKLKRIKEEKDIIQEFLLTGVIRV